MSASENTSGMYKIILSLAALIFSISGLYFVISWSLTQSEQIRFEKVFMLQSQIDPLKDLDGATLQKDYGIKLGKALQVHKLVNPDLTHEEALAIAGISVIMDGFSDSKLETNDLPEDFWIFVENLERVAGLSTGTTESYLEKYPGATPILMAKSKNSADPLYLLLKDAYNKIRFVQVGGEAQKVTVSVE